MSHTIDETTLRFANVDDLAQCMEIEYLSHEDPLHPETFLGLIGTFKVLLCVVDGQVLGYVIGGYVDENLRMLITRIAVHPSCRQRGIGSKLIQHCVDSAGGAGVTTGIVDFVMIPNDAPIGIQPFLADHGFELLKSAGCVSVYRKTGE